MLDRLGSRFGAVVAIGVLASACADEFTADASSSAGASTGGGGQGEADSGATGGMDHGGGVPDAADEPPIPVAGLLLWLRADAGVVQDDEGRVSTWTDQSAADNDGVQEGPDLRPKLLESALNGMPALSFDGVDDHFELPPGFSDFSEGLTMLAVVQSDGRGSCPGILEVSNGPEIDDVHVGRHSGELVYEVFTDHVAAGSFAPDVPRRVSVAHDPLGIVELSQSNGGGAVESVPLPASVERRFAYVGRTLYEDCPTWDGAIGELILYDRALSTDEFDTVEAYLDERWGI